MEKLHFKLEVYEGPLDLLLTLISKNKINIYDIPISLVLEQYLEQIDILKKMDLEVASEFLTMASNLLYIKSQMLLPKYDEEEEDPREKLVKMLLEYQRYKEMAKVFEEMSKDGFLRFTKEPDEVEFDDTYRRQHDVLELYAAYALVFKRAKHRLPPPVSSFSGIVGTTIISVSSKLVHILRQLLHTKKISFNKLFSGVKTRSEIVATFLAVLELTKIKKIKMNQTKSGDLNIHLVKEGKADGK